MMKFIIELSIYTHTILSLYGDGKNMYDATSEALKRRDRVVGLATCVCCVWVVWTNQTLAHIMIYLHPNCRPIHVCSAHIEICYILNTSISSLTLSMIDKR